MPEPRSLFESDARLRAKVSEQDFQLLRDALRQQFVTSVIVYCGCGLIFLAGATLFVYITLRPIPISLSSISAESTDPSAEGLSVDLDPLRVRWASQGDPEDVAVALEAMETQRRTQSKTVHSTEGQIQFMPEDYSSILVNRSHGGENRMRAVIQTAKSAFVSPEFSLHVGTTILAAHVEPLRIKIIGMIDNRAIDFYDFEARLVLWGSLQGQAPSPMTFGGKIKYGENDFMLDPKVTYNWGTAKMVYFGPDDRRLIRTQLLGF